MNEVLNADIYSLKFSWAFDFGSPPNHMRAAPREFPQGTIIGLFLYLINLNYGPGESQPFCSMFTDDTNMGGRTTEEETFHLDVFKKSEAEKQNGMFPNASRSQ